MNLSLSDPAFTGCFTQQEYSQSAIGCLMGKEGICTFSLCFWPKVLPFWAGNLQPRLYQLCSRGSCSPAAVGQTRKGMAKGAGNLELH